jgi:hypothetical protein
MVFYLYFDPAVIAAAVNNGPIGLACLLGIIRGFETNCFLSEFNDWHVQDELRDHVKALDDKIETLSDQEGAEVANGVKRLKSLLYTLAKRNRFICCLTSNGEPPSERVAAVLAQGKNAELDLVLVAKPAESPNPDRLPISTLQYYNASDFEARRSRLATNGMLFAPEQVSEKEFLNKTLRKMLKHCSTIQIYDEVMGNRWGDNFEYTIKTFLFWLEEFVAEPGKLQLHLYCGKPSGFLDNHMKGQLKSFCRGRLTNLPITIHFHDTLTGTDNLPHDRFMATDQIAIEIGRGMDFLDRRTHKNRDASLSLKDLTELGGFLKSTATSQIAPIPC